MEAILPIIERSNIISYSFRHNNIYLLNYKYTLSMNLIKKKVH